MRTVPPAAPELVVGVLPVVAVLPVVTVLLLVAVLALVTVDPPAAVEPDVGVAAPVVPVDAAVVVGATVGADVLLVVLALLPHAAATIVRPSARAAKLFRLFMLTCMCLLMVSGGKEYHRRSGSRRLANQPPTCTRIVLPDQCGSKHHSTTEHDR